MKIVKKDDITYAMVVLPKWWSPRIPVILVRKLLIRYVLKEWMLTERAWKWAARRQICDSVLLHMLGAPVWLTGISRPPKENE
ncbi:hypothetical protein LCGC14_0808410 [marine sediment metagenome]|uniref:Uncharacterized protein n=1 Tax=marine sediment metagenome TaxID=412755 RepID=A0A0F9PS26_9ZZZZ